MNDSHADPANAHSDPSPDGHSEGGEDGRAVSGAETLALADPRTVRKAPRFARIGVLSAVVGLISCALVTWLFARPTEFLSLPGVFLLLAVFLVPVFVFAGLAIALLLDGWSRRRARK